MTIDNADIEETKSRRSINIVGTQSHRAIHRRILDEELMCQRIRRPFARRKMQIGQTPHRLPSIARDRGDVCKINKWHEFKNILTETKGRGFSKRHCPKF